MHLLSTLTAQTAAWTLKELKNCVQGGFLMYNLNRYVSERYCFIEK